jgi:O-antigen ligase/tetratricopeptide (TPR) repeat protein
MPRRFVALLTGIMEGLVLALAVASAWPFGSVHAYFQWLLLVAVALLLGCWAGRVVLEGRVRWTPCPIALGLAGLCLLAMLQVWPLPPSWVQFLSPQTAALQDFLLPSSQEISETDLPAQEGATLSLAPGETRRRLLQWIAVLAVFCVVRNNLRTPGCLHRLAWLATANGVLLTLLGLSQLASSAPHMVYWSIPTQGQVFGPFICRNHFAFYVNLCLGLSGGLLLGTSSFGQGPRRGRMSWRDFFRDPRVLWLVCALVFMLAGLLASLSRGGVLGLTVGSFFGLVLLMLRSGGVTRWGAGILVFGLTALLLAWLGYDRISRRWESLWQDNLHGEARATVWARTFPLIARYPLWGTGLGTFGLIEPSTRQPGDPHDIFHDHAHNDYLELWIEGGLSQLLLAGLVFFLVLRQGTRAFFRHGTTATGCLALGGVVGCTAVIVHSFVDFGLHVPAVTLLLTVVAALLANLADPPTSEPSASWLASLLQATALLAVALLLVSFGRAEEQAERYRLASLTAPVERRVEYLQAAAAFAPDRADVHLALAEVLLRRGSRARGLTDLHEARRHVLEARRLSPLQLDAHEKDMRLAEFFAQPTLKEKALQRLLWLSPSDPAPWFWTGNQARERGDKEEACRCWRNALLRTNHYLTSIGKNVPTTLSAQELLDKVLPADPERIVAALDAVAALADNTEAEKLYLAAALAVLTARGEGRTTADYLLAARLHGRRDEFPQACAAYEQALARQPHNTGWRLEYCTLLHRAGLYPQAKRELRWLLHQEPAHAQALALAKEVDHKIAETQPSGR